jgi:hypothetical protein
MDELSHTTRWFFEYAHESDEDDPRGVAQIQLVLLLNRYLLWNGSSQSRRIVWSVV